MQKPITRRPLSKAEWSLFLAPLAILIALGIYTVLRPLFPRKIRVGKGQILSLTYSPDGKQLAVVSSTTRSSYQSDGTWLSLYDSQSTSQLWQQEVGGWCSDFHYSQDGKMFRLYCTLKRQKSTVFRDSQSRKILYRLPSSIFDLVLSSDGKMLVAQTYSNLILYDNVGNPLHTFTKNLSLNCYKAWSWSPSQKLVAALEIHSQDKENLRPCIWDENGIFLAYLPARKWNFVSFTDDDRYLILGKGYPNAGKDNSLQLWDWRKGKKIYEISQGPILFLGVSRDNKALIAQGNELRRLSLLDNKVLWSTNKKSATIAYFTDSKDRLFLSQERVKSARQRALLWNYQTGEILQTYEDVSAMAISPDGATISIGKRDGTVHLYNTSRFLK